MVPNLGGRTSGGSTGICEGSADNSPDTQNGVYYVPDSNAFVCIIITVEYKCAKKIKVSN